MKVERVCLFVCVCAVWIPEHSFYSVPLFTPSHLSSPGQCKGNGTLEKQTSYRCLVLYVTPTSGKISSINIFVPDRTFTPLPRFGKVSSYGPRSIESYTYNFNGFGKASDKDMRPTRNDVSSH